MKLLFFICISLLLFWSETSSAQTNTTANDSLGALNVREQTTENQQMDTEESFKYMGSQLLFQLKKRLHLTDEEEEKKQQQAPKAKKLSFFGIEIERE